MIAEMNLRTNESCIIADSIRIGDTEFVLGVSACQQPAVSVTWQCTGIDNYYLEALSRFMR